MNRLKELRIKANLRQEDIAKKLEITRGAYGHYETGKREMDYETLKRISQIYNVSIDYIIGDDALLYEKFPSESIYYIPVFATVPAGFDHALDTTSYDGEIQEVPVSITNGYAREDLFVFMVSGDSMYPALLDGDRVLVVRTSSVESGDIAVISYRDFEDGTVKKVMYEPNCDYVDLIPLNARYNPVRIQGEALEGVRVIGKVIYLFRKI